MCDEIFGQFISWNEDDHISKSIIINNNNSVDSDLPTSQENI